MRFSDQDLDELRAILREDSHQEVTRDDAAEIATRLIDIVRLLLRPLPGRGDRGPDD